MPSSSNDFSSSNARNNGRDSSINSCNSSDQSLISEAPLLDKVVVALEALQTSITGIEVCSSRCPHGLGFATLRVESLGIRRLAKLFFLLGGRSWGLPDPYRLETFSLPSSYQLKAPKDMKTVSQNPYHDHLFVYVDALKAGLRFPLHLFIIEFLNSSNLTNTQLSPNSWAILSAFIILCRLLEIKASVGVFRSFYVIRLNRDNGFCTLYARIGCGLFGNAPTSWKVWKYGFFTIPPPELGFWPIKTQWSGSFNNKHLNKLFYVEEKSIALFF